MSEKGTGRRGARTVAVLRRVLGTLLTGALVVAAGFAVGVVAGLALEDPTLVKDYVSGETREIELGREAEGRPAGEPESEAALRAPAPIRQGFSVQVGAFGDSDAARNLAETLEGAGYPVYVAAPEGGAERRWRVRVGPVSTRERAERVARELKSERSLPTWVLDESA